MITHKGFGLVAVLLIVAGVLVVGAGTYVALNPKAVSEPGDAYEQQADADTERKEKGWIELESSTLITWKFIPVQERYEQDDSIPETAVSVVIDGKVYGVGRFQGSCSEIGASGGVDGKGLLAGELSAAQCWFAGGGDEIGVFAHEDGGYQIMVGTLEEPIEGGAGFRGDFKIKVDVPL